MLATASSALFVVLRSEQVAQNSELASLLSVSLADELSSLAKANWHTLYDLNKGFGNHYRVSTTTGQLLVQGGDEVMTVNGVSFTRYFYMENVSRDSNGSIENVYNSLNDDPSTQKITAVASSQINASPLSVTHTTYLTRWPNWIFQQSDWSGGAGQEGPITSANSQFTSQTNVDFTTTPGSLVPITVNLNNVYVADLNNDRIQKFDDLGNFLLKWGASGTGNGQFKKPYGVAIDGLNNVYIVDKDNHRVQKFDSNGSFLFTWGSDGSGDGQFGHPQGLAIDNAGNIYVVDLDYDRVQKFNSNGVFLLKWGVNGDGNGQFKKPQDVAIDSSNNVYVVDQSNHRIQKFDASGNFILKWGANGTGNGQFTNPSGIGVDTLNNVYVADRDNDRIQKFDASGNFILKWGANGSGNGQFLRPHGVTADENNNIYATDMDNHRIQKFNSSGAFLLKWGSQGVGDGQFNAPRGLEQVPANCLGNCILTSSIFDTGVSGGAALNTIIWQGNQPSGTAVKFQIASAGSSSGPWTYLGSDGSSATYYAPAGPNVQVKIRSADHGNKRYFRYRVFFDTVGATVPRVDDVIINYSR